MLGRFLRQRVVNHCLRGASLQRFADRLSEDKFDASTTLIIMLGNSLAVNRSHFEILLRVLSAIEQRGIHKIILCALPYSSSMSYERNIEISDLNAMLCNVSFYNSKYQFFDSNKFVKHLKLNASRCYVSKKIKISIAKLLGYNIEPGHACAAVADGGGGAGARGRASPAPAPAPASLN